MKKFIITESDKENILKLYGLLTESLKDSLPSINAIKKLEKDYNVKIEDSHIEDEREQEGVNHYTDNGGVNSKSEKQLKNLLNDLYSKFPNAPKSTNKNCNSIPGCISGYRGYMTQATVFGGKMKERGQTVSQRQRVSALPGFSQHHTGKTFDILSVDNSFWDSNPDIKSWVEKNVGKYGFKISYPSRGALRDEEPWHIYYIGGESSEEKIKQEKNEKIEKKVDDYYADDDKDNPKIEEKIEKRYEIVGCSPKREYTESPTFNEVMSDSSVVIRIGHRGLPVEKFQKKLVDLGYSIGNCGVDGLFGPKTKKALEDYQEENGLTVSSAINQETLKSFGGVSKKEVTKSETKKDDNKKEETEKDENKTSKTSDDQYIIIRPDGYKGNKVHVFFGGSHTNPGYSKNGANMSAMKKYVNVLSPYANDVIIVITDHMNTLGNVKSYVGQKFGGKVTSLAGFSQGGKEAWKHADDGSLNLVGLIDPSTYETGLSFASNTILYCDPKNWGTSGFYGQTRKRLEWYCSNKEDYGGKVKCFNKGGTHMNFAILKDFYSKYGGRL